jgi:hypothetical protein
MENKTLKTLTKLQALCFYHKTVPKWTEIRQYPTTNVEQYHNRTVLTLTKISPNILLCLKIAVNKKAFSKFSIHNLTDLYINSFL